MTTTPTLAGRTLLISGGSRGIGLAIAVRAARDGANVALLAKTAEPHPRLPGTIYTAAEEIEAAGGAALPIVGDVRDDASVQGAVAATVERFGGIDVVINNASAINLARTPELTMKQYDLMQDINCRGSFLLTKTALPHLLASQNPHVLTLSPPLSLKPHWVGEHVGYTIAKYGMSLTTLGFAHEFAEAGVAVNSLWPRTLIATAAVANLLGDGIQHSRTPEIMSDAAHVVLTRPAKESTGNFFIDEDVLREAGVTDFAKYLSQGATEDTLQEDFYLD
jgi:citronellol/citronellal dehydrogenase